MNKRLIILTGLLVILLAGGAFGQDKAAIENDYEAKDDDWRFIISPYAMLASQATDVGGEQIRQSFNDLSSLTNFGFMLNTVVMFRKWVLTADGTYANLGSQSDESGMLQVNLDVKQYMLDLRLGYLVLTQIDDEVTSDVIRGWALEVNAGAKYWRNDISLDYTLGLEGRPPLVEDTFAEKQDWWDPMIGAKARFVLSKSVLLGVSLSGGGFGIGDASKYSWDFIYINTFKVSKLISVTAGFRSFRYKRVDGEGEDELETTVSVVGPVIGMSFVF